MLQTSNVPSPLAFIEIDPNSLQLNIVVAFVGAIAGDAMLSGHGLSVGIRMAVVGFEEETKGESKIHNQSQTNSIKAEWKAPIRKISILYVACVYVPILERFRIQSVDSGSRRNKVEPRALHIITTRTKSYCIKPTMITGLISTYLPEFGSNLVTTLASLNVNDFSHLDCYFLSVFWVYSNLVKRPRCFRCALFETRELWFGSVIAVWPS